MTFREALQHEITGQGLSVTEIARASGLSKGAIYNILNGKTVESRIRAATRRAIAGACNRKLVALDDGGVLFVESEGGAESIPSQDVVLRLDPFRPFLEDRFFREPFDWLHGLEEEGVLHGVGVVDRVFQKREDFLSLAIANTGPTSLVEFGFERRVAFGEDGPSERVPAQLPLDLPPGGDAEETLFVHAGPSFALELLNINFTDADGRTEAVSGPFRYVHRGEDP